MLYIPQIFFEVYKYEIYFCNFIGYEIPLKFHLDTTLILISYYKEMCNLKKITLTINNNSVRVNIGYCINEGNFKCIYSYKVVSIQKVSNYSLD